VARSKRRDYYDILGVARDADEVEVKRAFRELARKYHPDVNQDDAAAEDKFKEVNEAYAVLSDGAARARYDRFGHPDDGGGTASGIGAVVDAFDDMIGDVLRRRRSKQRGRDLRYTLEVSFEEASFGCTKTIKVPREGLTPREFSVAIPAGSREGAVKMLKGEGEPGKGGAPNGDLHVIVRIQEHPVFRREGNDVWCEIPVSVPQAALGAVIDVPTLDGKVRMRIPEGTQSGRVFRIRGRGVPRATGKSAPRGDQLVRVLVEIPTKLTAKQRELLEQLAGETGEDVAYPQKKGFLDKVRALFQD
jgi:molecular chaperone DnaJ